MAALDVIRRGIGPLSPTARRLLAVLGPGLVVMLADTDAGSVVTLAQSGAQWGYHLLPLQLLIIPVMAVAQELTVRLALHRRQGLGQLVRERFGAPLAWLATLALVLSCFGALLTQFSGLAGVGQLFGVPVWLTVTMAAAGVFVMVYNGSYHGVERVAMVLGGFELVFLLVAWKSHPQPQQLLAQLGDMPLGNRDFLYLIAANIGTSIMPWTLAYQQSALLDKGLGAQQLGQARVDTVIGAVVCQLVSIAVLVAAASTFNSGHTLESIPQIAQAFTPMLGAQGGRLAFALALSGSALVATIVVSLAAAWALGELSGRRHSLADHPRRAPWFYSAFGALLLLAAVVVSSGVDLVKLSIATGVLNALLLPLILVLLWWLARSALPPQQRLRGAYGWLATAMLGLCVVVSLYTGVAGILG